MKVKSIKNDLFNEIKNKSFDKIKEELNESSKYLSKTLGIDFKVSNINESYVIYSSPNPHAYLKATYSFTENKTIKLENFETLVIDSKSIEETRRNILKNIVESIFENSAETANDHWNELMKNINIKEMVIRKASKGAVTGDPGTTDNADEENQAAQGRARAGKKGAVRGDEEMAGSGKASSGDLSTLKAVDPSLEENLNVLPNFNSLRMKLVEAAKKASDELFPEKSAVKVKTKDGENGEPEIDSVEINTQDKSEKTEKIKKASKKNKEKIAESRFKFSKNENNKEFVGKIIDIKRFNNAEAAQELSEALTDLVIQNPNIVYVSKDELKDFVSRIFDSNKEENWTEDLCEEIAYGLRKLAYNTYLDKAYEVIKSAAVDGVVGLEEEVSDDSYEAFEEVSSRYFESIYSKAAEEKKVLSDLSEMLVRVSETLEADLKAAGLKNVGTKTLAEYRQFAAQMAASAKGPINESIVKMVVGSLLSSVADDYSLNNATKLVPYGHFRPSIDLDDSKYGQWVGDGKKDSVVGDEEMNSPNNGNPMTPKSMDKDKLDLEDGKYKVHADKGTKDSRIGDEEMSSPNDGNPMSPKYKKSSELDLS